MPENDDYHTADYNDSSEEVDVDELIQEMEDSEDVDQLAEEILGYGVDVEGSGPIARFSSGMANGLIEVSGDSQPASSDPISSKICHSNIFGENFYYKIVDHYQNVVFRQSIKIFYAGDKIVYIMIPDVDSKSLKFRNKKYFSELASLCLVEISQNDIDIDWRDGDFHKHDDLNSFVRNRTKPKESILL